jgi:NitT/TauT family transport system substrate-binding protein
VVRRLPAAALVAAAALTLTVACSSATPTTGGAEPTFAAPAGPVAGCGPQAASDPTERSASRQPARCAAGSPAPAPLAQRQKVTLAAQTKGEYLAPVLVGMAKGEFEKENLDVELASVPFADALPQLASGTIDMAQGGPYASVVNAVQTGFDVRWALGNFFPPHGGDVATPQSGLWFRRDAFTDPAHPSLAALKTKPPVVANTQGSGTPAVLWLEKAFREAGIDFSTVQFQSLAPADQVTALQSGAVQGAYLLDPYWRQIGADPAFVQLAVQPREVNGGIFYGPSLLGQRADVGEAFARAYIRTINTYLQGDYKKTSDVVAALAQQIGTTPDVIAKGDPLVFDWEVPSGLYTDLEKLYIQLGTAKTVTAPIAEDKLVTRTFYDRAVGHGGAS